jgi:PhnB protein
MVTAVEDRLERELRRAHAIESKEPSMQTTLNPYVAFDGDCEAAVKFWGEVLRAETTIMRMGDSPMPYPPEAKNRVMHATVRSGSLLLMASDTMPGQPFSKGGQVALSLNLARKEEQQRVWDGLLAGGKVELPLGDQFWGRFGMLVDKFGLRWMLNHESKQP